MEQLVNNLAKHIFRQDKNAVNHIINNDLLNGQIITQLFSNITTIFNINHTDNYDDFIGKKNLFEYTILSLLLKNKMTLETNLFEDLLRISKCNTVEREYPVCDIMDILLSKGYNPCSNDLLIACRHKLPIYIDKFASHDIKLTREHFNELFDDKKLYCYNKKYTIGYTTRFNQYDYAINVLQQILDIFIKHKYIFSQDDIIKANDALCPIPNIHTINLSIAEILKTQQYSTYFPYIIKNGSLVGNLLYALIYSDSSIPKITKYIKFTKILPDQDCLSIAIKKLLMNFDLVKLLIGEYKLRLPKEIIRKYIENNVYGSNGNILLYFFDRMIDEKINKEFILEEHINSNKDDNVNDNIGNYDIVDIVAKEGVIINNKNKQKQKVNDIVVEMLNLKHNMISIIELKKCIIKYIKSSKLLIGNIIIANDKLSQVLGIKKGNAILFEKIDVILSYCL